MNSNLANVFQCTFCGRGNNCKWENHSLWQLNAIEGLYSTWITDDILASQRPSELLINQYNLIKVFKENNIGAVFCLQQKGEHPLCGPNNGLEASGFTYKPETFTSKDIQFHHFGWLDMTAPGLDLIFKCVTTIIKILDNQKRKVTVHCHAGLGRTGLIIACVLVLRHFLSANEAIALVRNKRNGSLQTKKQVLAVYAFEEECKSYRYAFWHVPRRKRVYKLMRDDIIVNDTLDDASLITLPEFIKRQRYIIILKNNEAYRLYYIPKLVYEICKRLSDIHCNSSIKMSAAICEAFATFDGIKSPSEKLEFVTLKNEINLGNFEGVRNNLNHSLLIDALLFWFISLREPVITPKVQMDLTKATSQSPLTLSASSSRVNWFVGLACLDKITFHTINVVLHVFRNMPNLHIILESVMERLAIILTYRRIYLTNSFNPNGILPALSMSPRRRGNKTLPPLSGPPLSPSEDDIQSSNIITGLLKFIYQEFTVSEITLKPILSSNVLKNSIHIQHQGILNQLGVELYEGNSVTDVELLTPTSPIITSPPSYANYEMDTTRPITDNNNHHSIESQHFDTKSPPPRIRPEPSKLEETHTSLLPSLTNSLDITTTFPSGQSQQHSKSLLLPSSPPINNNMSSRAITNSGRSFEMLGNGGCDFVFISQDDLSTRPFIRRGPALLAPLNILNTSDDVVGDENKKLLPTIPK